MIIVNFATKEYARAQQRLKNSLQGHHYLMFDDYAQIGSPTHAESPYEFKIHAMEKAFNEDPIVLWADSSMYRVGDLSTIEGIIKRDGYFMEECGHYVKDWCKPETRNWFELKPEEDKFIMFSAGLLGLDFNHPDAQLWFAAWIVAAKKGHFRGDWSNHRHDMTCGSIIAQRMGFKYQRGGSHLAYIGDGYSKPEDGVVFYCRGMV